MEVGCEFTTWTSFIQELDKFSKDNEVSYSVGLCNPVDESGDLDFKFKYSYARMVCSQGNALKYDKRKEKKSSSCICSSSILIRVNKERTALEIMEVNLKHNHNKPSKVLTAQTQLKGNERRLASVLLRGGVTLNQVQEFLCCVRDRSNESFTCTSVQESSSGNENLLLFHLDQLMADDPGCVVEFVDFDLIPDVVYFQTYEMKKRMEQMGNNLNSSIQIITHKHMDGKFSVVGIVAVNKEMNCRNVLAFCITVRQQGSIIRNIVEAFVRQNQEFCNSVKGLVMDCDREDSDFVHTFFPQAHIAWTEEFIVKRFEKYLKDLTGCDGQHDLVSLFQEIMNSSTESEYRNLLTVFLEGQNSDFSAHFQTQWDSCKKLWVRYEIDSVDSLRHQKAALENGFTNFMEGCLKPNCEFSDILLSLIHMDKDEEVENCHANKTGDLKLNPCFSFYRSLCLPEAAEAVICQVAIGESGCYNIRKSGSRVFIQRLDLEEHFTLNVQGTSCSCQYFRNNELPCEHIFAWRSTYDLNMCEESLIPLKWQALGESVTLDSLAQSLSQGYVPSSAHHDERLKALQTILKDILTSCSSRSYEDMGRDIILLKQVLNVIKHGNVEIKNKMYDVMNVGNERNSPATTYTSTPLPKKRGRKSKKEKEMLAAKDGKESLNETGTGLQNQSKLERRHNLRTNIKHKFVTREDKPRPEATEVVSDISSDCVRGATLNVLQLNSGRQTLEENDFRGQWSKDNDVDDINIPKDQSTSLSDRTEDVVINIQAKRLKRDDGSYFEMNDDRKFKIIKTNDGNDCSSTESDSYDEGEDYLSVNRLVNNSLDPEEESEGSDEKRAQFGQDLSKFLEGMSVEFLQELMQGISMLDHFDERSQNDEEVENGQLIYPVDFVIHACQKDRENLDFVIRNLEKQISDYNKFAYKVAASLILMAFNTGSEVSEMRESINDWPSHLPPLSTSPDDDVGLPLEPDQFLTVCGYKLDKTDVETLNSHSELSPRVIHAYLEVLAQRHNGKLFVIPFDVVQHWRNETFGEMLFKKVHFKTFDYLVLPIHCGAELSREEAAVVEDGEMVKPHWMVLLADVRAKTVGMLNPRTEDRYLIAANGYMLQWRRYMQIRSVLTGEILSSWTTQNLHCNKQTMDHTSGALAIMNVEAVISNVPPCVMTEAHINHYVHYVGVTLRDTDRETTVLCVGGLQCQEMAARDTDWLQCQNCRAWWHKACCGCEGDEVGDPDTFYCSPCKQRMAAVKKLGGGILEKEEGEDSGVLDFEQGERKGDDEEDENRVDDDKRMEVEDDDDGEDHRIVVIQGSLDL